MYKHTLLGLLLFCNTLHCSEASVNSNSLVPSNRTSYIKYGLFTATALGVYAGCKYMGSKLRQLNTEAQAHPETFILGYQLVHGRRPLRRLILPFLNRDSKYAYLMAVARPMELPPHRGEAQRLVDEAERLCFRLISSIYLCQENDPRRASELLLHCIYRAKPLFAIHLLNKYPSLAVPDDTSATPPLHAAVDAYKLSRTLCGHPLFTIKTEEFKALITQILTDTQEDQPLYTYYSPVQTAVERLHLPTLKYLAEYHSTELDHKIPRSLAIGGREQYPLQHAWYCEGWYRGSPNLKQAQEATAIIRNSVRTTRLGSLNYCLHSAPITKEKWKNMGVEDREQGQQA